MAPWVPTKKKDIERFLNILEMQEGEKFLEIGTWDGRVAAAVAKRFPKNLVLWIELAPPIYIFARIRKFLARNDKNLYIKLWNAFSLNFWDYEHIYVFGMPEALQKKIIPKFLKQARSWAKLYSYVFSIPEQYKGQVITYGGEYEAKIHILEKSFSNRLKYLKI